MSVAREIQSVNRVRQIAKVATRHGLAYFISSADPKRFIPFHQRFLTRRAEKITVGPKALKNALEELGGAFVKLGQILSLRPDLVPIEYSNELAKLQDKVKPMDFSTVKHIIETELKKPINSVFKTIKEQAEGSGSIAQVHAAELLDGTHVAVKVQRPHIKEIFENDIRLMYRLARTLQTSGRWSKIDLVRIVKEFEEYSAKELNFFREIKNIKRSYDNFKDYPNVRIPQVYFEYCSEKIIVMDYMEGTKLSELGKTKKYDKKQIAENLVQIYLKESIEDGFFHADLHPGNIMICGDGCITLLDFGIFGTIDYHLKSYLMNFLSAVMEENSEQITEVIVKDFDQDYTNSVNWASLKEDIEDIVVEWKAQASRRRGFSDLILKIVHLCVEHDIKIPANMVLFSKGLFTVESTCLALYPNLNFVEDIRPYFEGLLKQKGTKEVYRKVGRILSSWQHWAEEIPEKAERIINQLDKGLLRISFEVDHKEFDDLKTSINHVGNRVISGLICAALVVGSALLINVGETRIAGISWISLAGFIIAGILAVGLAFSNKI